jgi:hypothetical protein
MYGAMGSDARDAQVTMDLFRVSWTNGQVVKTDTGEFLVTYKIGAAQFRGGVKSSPKLQLNLVRKDAILEIAPRQDITRDTLKDILEGEAQAGGAANDRPGDARPLGLSNHKQSALAMMIYASDYDDVLPYVQDTRSAFALVLPYTKDTAIFKSVNPNGGRMLLNMAVAGVALTEIPEPAETILFYDSTPWPDGTRLVSFADGHAKFVDAQEWHRIERSLRLKLKRHGKPLPPGLDKRLYPGQDFG